MKEENKYIETLFDAARQEAPKVSFEETAASFERSLNPSFTVVAKTWFMKNFYLNSILILLGLLALSVTVFVDLDVKGEESSSIESNIKSSPSITTEIDHEETENEERKEVEIDQGFKVSPNKRSSPAELSKATRPKTSDEKVSKSNIANRLEDIPIENTEKRKHLINNVISTVKREDKNQTEVLKEKPEPVPPKKENRSTVFKKKQSQTNLEMILETALNSESLKNDLFIKNSEAEFEQLVLLTNGKFDDLINLSFSGKKVIILSSFYDGSFNLLNDDYVNVQGFEIDDNKAFFSFIYNGVDVQVFLVKDDKVWLTANVIISGDEGDLQLKESLIQMALNHENMSAAIGINAEGEFNRFALLANDYLSKKIDANFKGEKLEVVLQKGSKNFNSRNTFLEFKNFKVKRKKASFEFLFKRKVHQVSYRKKNEEWIIHSFKELE